MNGTAGQGKTKPVRGTLISVAEAAKRMGMSKRWLYDRMSGGTCPVPYFLLSAGRRAMDSADIDDWLLTVKVPPGKFPGEN
jgi:predicted DNA-binding transcriptional regulator AlpA